MVDINLATQSKLKPNDSSLTLPSHLEKNVKIQAVQGKLLLARRSRAKQNVAWVTLQVNQKPFK
jgi:hypothetical protein